MSYIPARGDLIWMDFNPQKGREQAGHRPGLVLSSQTYNRRGLMLVCPVTSRHKNYWFEVPITAGKINGCVLADHVKSQDWRGRGATFAEKAPESVVKETLSIIALLLIDD